MKEELIKLGFVQTTSKSFNTGSYYNSDLQVTIVLNDKYYLCQENYTFVCIYSFVPYFKTVYQGIIPNIEFLKLILDNTVVFKKFQNCTDEETEHKTIA